MDTIEKIKNYRPWNEQEQRDQALILDFLAHNPDAFCRSNLLAHKILFWNGTEDVS